MSEQDFNSDMMSYYSNMEENKFLDIMKAKNHKGLAEQVQKKAERENNAIANIFEKMRTKEINSAPASDPNVLNEDAPFPSVASVTPTKPIIVKQQLDGRVAPKPEPVNKENEPKNINWKKISIAKLVSLYPQSQAVSDLYMVLHGATQQPGMSYALLAPHGTKFLVKADETGTLFIADPNNNPKAFANIGLNPDFDSEGPDDEKGADAAKPVNGNNTELVKPKLESIEDFDVDINFSEKIEEKRIDLPDNTTPRAVNLVNKLRNMASELRGESSKESTYTSKKGVQQLQESQEKTYSVKKLNNMLFECQEKLSATNNPVYEEIADDLSEIIAEALLSNKTSVPVSKVNSRLNKKRG